VPFIGETDADTALARLQRDPTDLSRLRPTLSKGLIELVHRCLSRNPNRRPATGAELRTALQQVAGEPSNTLATIEPVQPPPRVPNGVRPVRNQPRRDPGPSGRTLAARAIAGEPSRTPLGTAHTRGTPPQPPLPRREPPRDPTPSAGPKLRGRPAKDMQTRFAPSFVMICLLLAVGLVVSLILWATIRPNDPDGPPPTTVIPTTPTTAAPPADAITIAGVTSFDPRGNGSEHEELAQQALADGNPETNWITECYSDQYMGKDGVGLVITLPTATAGALTFDIGHAPYQVDVYASTADPAPPSREAWGSPIAHEVNTAPGRADVAVASPAKYLLILVMEPGVSESGCNPGTPHQGMIGEVAFAAAS
jgi:serine/threonine-protein kinase